MQTFNRSSKKLVLILICCLSGFGNAAFAQDSTASAINQKLLLSVPGNTKFLITGSGYADFSYNSQNDVKSNFTGVGFSPIFLWKLSDKLFFEGEVEVQLEGGETGLDLEYAKFSYILNKYMTIGAGRMLTPFGTYLERLHPTFIERFPNEPLMIKHQDGTEAIGPNGAELGVDLRGGFQLGDAKMNYVVYVSNGPKLNDGIDEPAMAGALEYENFTDNNSNKAIGGRIGLLPFSNSSLEIGLSINRGKAGNVGSKYANVMANAYAIDLSYVKSLPEIESIINIKGQYNSVTTDKSNYSDATGTSTYTFDNTSHVYYVQLGIRPSMSDNKFLKNIELLGRYNSVTLPETALWGGGNTTRTDIGLCYWLSWRSGIRFAYETQKNPDGQKVNQFLVRYATGF